MSDSPELDTLIARARKAGGEPERLARVRARLVSQAILAPPGTATTGPTHPPTAHASTGRAGAPTGGAGAPTGGAGASAPAWAAVAILATLGISGWLMHRASTVPSRLDETATTTEAETATETETETMETATETATATAETETATATDTATATETETETETETDTATATETETTETALHPHAAGPRAAIAPEPSEPENPSSSLREEIALLDRALRAREAGDVALARRLLRDHEARFPEGTLVPERERLRGEIDRAGERSESPSP